MEAEEKIKQEYVREEKEISENKTVLYIYDGLNGNKTFEIDEDETATKLRKMFGKEALTESSQGWRGTAKYYIDFGDGYAIGVYKNEPYCYIGTGVYEQDGYLMLSGDPGISEMLRYGRQIRFQVIIQRRLSLLEIGHIEGSYRAKRST